MDLSAELRMEYELLAVEQEHTVHCMLEITAPRLGLQSRRRPLHLAIVIDRSESMRGEGLRRAARCAGALMRRLRPDDQVSIVSYGAEASLELPLAEVGSRGPHLELLMRSMQAGGRADLSAGWSLGSHQLRDIPGGRGPKRVLLFSDGLTDRGITDQAGLEALASDACDDGIATTTITLTDKAGGSILGAMAHAGGGHAHALGHEGTADELLEREFVGLAPVVARDVSVLIGCNERAEMMACTDAHAWTASDDGVLIHLGDAYAGERRCVIFRLLVPAITQLGPAKIADLVLRSVMLSSPNAARAITMPITVNLASAAAAERSRADRQIIEEIAVQESLRTRRLALEHDEAPED
jgi:Ca-activated chloride channel family protein